MKEQQLDTYIGEDLEVMVHFDYEPAEKQTHDCPASESNVTINSVEVRRFPSDKDILECLNKEWLQILSERCLASIEEQ